MSSSRSENPRYSSTFIFEVRAVYGDPALGLEHAPPGRSAALGAARHRS